MASTTTVTINQSTHTYPIRIGSDLLSACGTFLREVLPKANRCLVVTDAHVAPLYLEKVKQALLQAGLTVETAMVGLGENDKTLDTIEQLYDKALAFSIKRNDVILALGGGIVGDMAGFFAATYQRGVPFVQVPTTLLAQVDASVGGKVAVNWRHLKNLIGAFYHPHGVLIDTDTLNTLPSRDFSCGMAEVIKYSLIEESVPGEMSETPLLSILQTGAATGHLDLEAVITRCCRLKAAVVEADPDERKGIREILNFGHTFAHAYETLSTGNIPHGEAVSLGMVKAYQLAEALGQIPLGTTDTVIHLIEAFALPTEPAQEFSGQEVLNVMYQDKKTVQAKTLRLVLPSDVIGKVRIQEIASEEAVRKVLGVEVAS